MSEELELKLVDRRTVDRYLARGRVSDRDYEKYLKSLPDMSDKAESIAAEQPETPAPDAE